MGFDDMLRRDAVNVFANPSEFGEEITYTPAGSSALTGRRAVVTRRPEVIDESLDVPVDEIHIDIPRDATYGVESVTEGADTVEFPEIEGDASTMQTFRVREILSHDAAMWRLAVEGGI